MGVPFALEWLIRRPYCDLHPRFVRAVEQLTAWPAPSRYHELAEQVPRAEGVHMPRFVVANRDAQRAVGGYEQHVAQLNAVPTRLGDWHDFFNMAVWAHFPQLRWALNSLHVDPNAGPIDPRNGRAPAQNLAASFDESGILVLSTSPAVLDELRALRFKQAFWERRAEVLETTRFWVVGHGMLESLLNPRQGLVARGVFLHIPSLPMPQQSDELRFEIDARVAAAVHAWRSARPVLDPIPVLAIPGYSDNESVGFYDDARNVRFEPVSRRPSVGT
ncbi:MAG: DUF3025 domain-containing protein [Polyangiaceae bacterium]